MTDASKLGRALKDEATPRLVTDGGTDVASEDDRTDSIRDATEADPMLAVYRHDVHKLRGHSHATAEKRYAGVPVNEQVPLGADGDAARLSRPPEHDEPLLDRHDGPLRRSLLTGERVAEDLPARADGPRPTPRASDRARTGALQGLVTIETPEHMHRAWLRSQLPATVAESLYYPYTSLKYHTLLAAALLDAYRAGYAFEDLFLVVDHPSRRPVGARRRAGHKRRQGRRCRDRTGRTRHSASLASLSAPRPVGRPAGRSRNRNRNRPGTRDSHRDRNRDTHSKRRRRRPSPTSPGSLTRAGAPTSSRPVTRTMTDRR